MFMPDGPHQTQPPSGVADITPADPETTTADIALMQRVLAAASRNPNLIPADFMSYLLDWIQTQRLQVPIGQVFGFTGFTFRAGVAVATPESTTSTSYGDLATPGPFLSGLSDGSYAVFFGADVQAPSGSAAYASISPNGATPSDDDAIKFGFPGTASPDAALFGLSLCTMREGDGNSLKLQYKSAGGLATFSRRRLIAVKYAN